jgi:hypothetical protein
MSISKKIIIHTLAIIWFIFSIGYICYDVWSDFKVKALTQAYQQGRTDTVNALIQQAKDCQTVPIFSGETQIQVVDVSCLKAQNTGSK